MGGAVALYRGAHRIGMYKFKSSGFEEFLPNDEDLLQMIRDGMPGTAMPVWGDVLSNQDMADLVVHIKTYVLLVASGIFIYFIGAVRRGSKS